MKKLPLSGLRILDATLFMAGPLGTQILENLGAEVIKIERCNDISDFSRCTEPTFGNSSAYFIAINGGKKDVSLNLKDERHREIFLRLAEKCDIVAENFRPGVTDKLRIAYEDVKKVNPEIIYSSVSGFGQTGPYKTRGCVDTVAQAMSGFMSLTGREEEEPIRAGSSIADVCGSLYEAVGILAAIISKEKTGKGEYIDAPMLSAMMAITGEAAADYLNCGVERKRTGNRSGSAALSQTIPVRNGAVMVIAEEDQAFEAFVEALGIPWLAKDERFRSAKARLENITQLEEIIYPICEQMSMNQLADLCRSNCVPAGEVFTQEQISRSGYLEDAQMLRTVYDAEEGFFQVLTLPIRFDRFDVTEDTFVPSPGQHNREVLGELLGMTEDEIKELYDNPKGESYN